MTNTDCDLVTRLWTYLNDPGSGDFYLRNIIQDGLDVPSLGIKIPPFPTVEVGDIPEQTMFQWALEYLGVSMSGTVLSGLGTYTGGAMTCTPVSDDETKVDLTLNFAAVEFTGSYDVGASGLTGCAVATAASVLGGGTAANAEGSRLDLAVWFRDNDAGLNGSQNGQDLVGAYYLHQDTIEAVTTSDSPPAKLYRQTLAAQRPTGDAVTASTAYYRDEHDPEREATGSPPPPIGTAAEYSGGFKTYGYLLQAVDRARQAAGLPLQANDNEYAELMNAMVQFNAQVKRFQRDEPGPHDTAAIMNFVAKAEPLSIEELEDVPIHDEAGEVADHVPGWPIDRARLRAARAARAPEPRATDEAAAFHVKGTFRDRGQQVSIRVVVTFSSTGEDKLRAEVDAMALRIGDLDITLGNKEGFDKEPGLYDRVSTWIANTRAFQDLLKSRLSSAVNAPGVRADVTASLNAGLKKLGLQ